MAVEGSFENIVLKEKEVTLFDKIKVNASFDVNTAEVTKVLSVNGILRITDKSVEEGKVKYSGKAIFFLCYLNENEEIVKSETQKDFSGEIISDKISEESKVCVFSETYSTEIDISGIKLGAKLSGEIKAEVNNYKQVKLLNGGNNIVCKEGEGEYLKSLGIHETVYSLQEEFEINYCVKQVISQRAKAVITQVQCGMGVIIIDGEVHFGGIFLQNGDKKGIIRENKKIPFRAEIECEDALPSCCAIASCQEKSFKSELVIDEDKGNTNVTISVVLVLTGEGFSKNEIACSLDAFSITDEIALTACEEEYFLPEPVKTVQVKATGRSTVSELSVGSTFCACDGERFEIVSYERKGCDLLVTGILSFNGIFSDNEKIYTRKMETPCELKLSNIVEGQEFTLSAFAFGGDVKVVSLSEMEMEGEIYFSVRSLKSQKICGINGISSLGDKKAETCAISIYLAGENEELWSLAKRLNVSPKELIENNEDLTFPLSGEERIVVYRQKT